MTTQPRSALPAVPRVSDEEARRYQARWDELQAGFVSDPRGALARADELLSDLTDAAARRVAEERRALRGRWEPEDTPTESLRVSMQTYRDLLAGFYPAI